MGIESKHIPMNLSTLTSYPQFSFPGQKVEADKIVQAFQSGCTMVSLVAPPQWGKTGTFIDAIGKMCDARMVHIDKCFVMTGLPQKDWETQTYERISGAFMMNGYQTSLFHKENVMKLSAIKHNKFDSNTSNTFIVIDECHIASGKNQTIAKELFDRLKLIEGDASRNVFVLQVSATPDNVAWYAIEEWGADSPYHKLQVVEKYPESYTSFQTLINNGRVMPSIRSHDNKEQVKKMFLDEFDKDETPKYHIIREPHKTAHRSTLRDVLRELEREGVTCTTIEHKQGSGLPSKTLDSAPLKPTVITVIRKWGCAQTLNDTHIGMVHDTYYKATANVSAVVQGLAGRLCGHGRSEETRVYCYMDALNKYLDLESNGFNYKCLDDYKSTHFHMKRVDDDNDSSDSDNDDGTFVERIKAGAYHLPSDKQPGPVELTTEQLEAKEREQKERATHINIPYYFNISQEQMKPLADVIHKRASKKNGNPKETPFLNIIKSQKPELFMELQGFKLNDLAQCKTDDSYGKKINAGMNAFLDKRPWNMEWRAATPHTENTYNVYINIGKHDRYEIVVNMWTFF